MSFLRFLETLFQKRLKLFKKVSHSKDFSDFTCSQYELVLDELVLDELVPNESKTHYCFDELYVVNICTTF